MDIQDFRDVYKNRHQISLDLKAEGRMVMNYACIYIPEEILHAAGVVTMRILGTHEETPIGDAYIHNNMCTYLRSCGQELFTGKLDHLDGFISCNSCDHTRRFYDTFKHFKSSPFMYNMHLPHKTDEQSLNFYLDSVKDFKNAVEDHLKVTITDEKLWESIKLFNETRKLLNEIWELRKSYNPPITGSEALDIVLAGLVQPREKYNQMLKEILPVLKQRVPDDGREDLPRVMLMSSEMDDSAYLKIIEEQGCLIVTDDVCIGTRYFATPVDETMSDPFEAIAKRYLQGNTCPRFYNGTLDSAMKLYNDYECEGIIYIQLKFCDLTGGFYVILKDTLKETETPILYLDREYVQTGIGQMKTRVQAFLESMGF